VKRILLITCLILFVLLGGAIWYLSCTEGGLRRLFHASTGYIPGEISVTSLEGRLIGPIKIAGLNYRAEGFTLSIDQFTTDWKPLELFSLRVHIAKLETSGVRILTKAAKDAPPAEPKLPDLRLPLEIVIEDTRVRDISVKAVESDATFEIGEVNLGAHLFRESFRIHRLDVKAPLFDVALTGDLTPQGDYPLDMGVQWSLRLPGYSPVAGSGRLSGSLARLEVTQKIDSPAKARIAATLFKPLEKVRWEASLDLDAFQGAEIREGFPDVALTGEMDSSGTPAVFDLRGSFAASWPRYGNVTGDFLGGHRDGVWKLEKLLLAIPGTDARVSLRGEFGQAAGPPSFSVEGEWKQVAWPLHGKEAGYVSPEGTVSAKGAPEDFSFRADARLEGKNIPQGKWGLSGQRKGGEINLDMLRGRLLGGEVAGRGVLRWQPEVAWNVSIDGREIDPGAFAGKWPGSLSFTAASTGEIREKEPRVKLDIKNLAGELRGYPVRGGAEIAIAGDRYTFPRVELRSGTALITASGDVSDRWNVRWKIEAEDLRDLIPDGQGSVRGKGRVSGSRPVPRIEALLAGKDVAAGTIGAGAFEADIAIDLSDSEDSRIDVTASGIYAGTRQFDSFSLKGTGKLVSHDLSAALKKGGENVAVALAGGYENRSWDGVLSRGDFTTEKFGSWSLLEKEVVSLSADRAQTGDLCFGSNAFSICSRIEWLRKKGLDGKITITDLPLSLFGPALPEKITPAGALTGSIEGTYGSGGMLSGKIGLTTTSGEVAFLLDERKIVKLPFAGSVLEGSLDEEALHARLDVTVSDEEFLRGTLTLPLFSPLNIQAKRQVLSSSWQISLEEPGLVPALFPELENTSGRVLGNLAFSGTLASPLFTGEVALSQAAADIPGLGTRIEDVRVAALSDGSGVIKIDGKARSNEGAVRIGGTVDVGPRKEKTALLKIKGERFEAIKTPEAWILVSPDLTVRLTEKVLRLDGQLEIPEATIEPRDLSGAVTPSRDVTVIREAEEEKKEEKFEAYSNVRLILGDKVNFNGFGLSGRITGSILAVDEPEKLTTASGELKILEGKYKAYGQKLEMEKGRVIFFGGPIDDPGLDIRAVRRIDEVVAGVDVSGTVKSPRLTLFSNPAMDQSDALSYLLLGRPVNEISSGEGQQLQKAALSAGLSGGDLIAKKIGSLFGLEEVGLTEGTEQEEASLIVGKYLSPKLYISYGIGLFEPISTYRIRYNISSRWLVQTEYGLNSGADLFYRIER
jgi:translocation and assembly module TamB